MCGYTFNKLHSQDHLDGYWKVSLTLKEVRRLRKLQSKQNLTHINDNKDFYSTSIPKFKELYIRSVVCRHFLITFRNPLLEVRVSHTALPFRHKTNLQKILYQRNSAFCNPCHFFLLVSVTGRKDHNWWVRLHWSQKRVLWGEYTKILELVFDKCYN